MYGSAPIGSTQWAALRKGFRSRYVLRDTVGPVLPDQGKGAQRQDNLMSVPFKIDVNGCLAKRPQHRGGLTVAPAPVPATHHVASAPEPELGILDENEVRAIMLEHYDEDRSVEEHL